MAHRTVDTETVLKRSFIKRSTKPMTRGVIRRTPMKQKSRKASLADFTPQVRQQILDRSRGLDEITGRPLEDGAQWHHRSPRQIGGSRHDARKGRASNGLLINPSTHEHVEKHSDEAYRNGWKVHQGHDPAAIPVLLHDGWHTLHEDGTMTFDPRENRDQRFP